jgi:hypothetical protein
VRPVSTALDRLPNVRGYSHLTPEQRADLAPRVADAYQAGASIRQIAAAIGRSYATARELLREANVPLRPRGSRYSAGAGNGE